MIVFIYWVYIVLALSSSLGARTGIKQLTQILSPKKSLGNCKADTGATLADIESLKAKTIPKTKTGRCFMECLFNTANIMKDGKFDKNGMVIAFTPALKGDLTKMGKLKELSEVCAKEIGPNKHKNCEGGQKFVECLAKHGNSYGLAFSTHVYSN
nr:general odorant-binding protein 19d-like [Leptinotarsa decemlineata]